MSKSLHYRVVRGLNWQHMRVAEDEDTGKFFVLGFEADTGKWRLARRDAHGCPQLFADDSFCKTLCRGVMGDCEIECEGDDLLLATVPISGGNGHDVDYVTRDLVSSDGGLTWVDAV